MDIAAIEELLTPEGLSLLDALPEYDDDAALGLSSSLRAAGYSASLVSTAMTQSRLRARGRAKMGEFAAGMLFTPDGLEQATRLGVAARHAGRYQAAGVGHVLDLGCGIGADAMAAASLDLGVTAVDADEVTARIAAYNVRMFPEVHVDHAQAEDVPLTGAGGRIGAWLDPARRVRGRTDATGRTRRVFNLDSLSPSWSFVQSVAEQIPATAAKLSPSFPHGRIPPGCEAAWTSYDGEVVECTLWWGPLAATPGRTATLLRHDGTSVVLTQEDAPALGPVAAGPPVEGTFLYDPDRAVIASGLVGALVRAVDGVEAGNGTGYVLSDEPAVVPFARRYVVTAALPLHVKVVRAWLRNQGVGRLTIKKRGIEVNPDVFRKQLGLDGRGDELTVVLTRCGREPALLAVEPT